MRGVLKFSMPPGIAKSPLNPTKCFQKQKNKLSAARRPSRRSDFCDFTDFQGRRVYPNLRISTAAGVGQKPPRAMIGSVLIFKAAGDTKMYGCSKPPWLPQKHAIVKKMFLHEVCYNLPSCMPSTKTLVADAGARNAPATVSGVTPTGLRTQRNVGRSGTRGRVVGRTPAGYQALSAVCRANRPRWRCQRGDGAGAC